MGRLQKSSALLVLMFLLVKTNADCNQTSYKRMETCARKFKEGQNISIDLRSSCFYWLLNRTTCDLTMWFNELRFHGIMNIPSKVALKQNISCELVYDEQNNLFIWNKQTSHYITEMIKREYLIYLMIDNLPANQDYEKARKNLNTYYGEGYPLGGVEDNQVYINNYLKLTLSYYKSNESNYRVSRFEVEARSVDTSKLNFDDGNTCILSNDIGPQFVNLNGTQLYFLYSVEWKPSNVSDIRVRESISVSYVSAVKFYLLFNLSALLLSMGCVVIKRLFRKFIFWKYHVPSSEKLEDSKRIVWKRICDKFWWIESAYVIVLTFYRNNILFPIVAVIVSSTGVILFPQFQIDMRSTSNFLYILTTLIAGVLAVRIYCKMVHDAEWQLINSSLFLARKSKLTTNLRDHILPFYSNIMFITCFFVNALIWDKMSMKEESISITSIVDAACLALPLICFGISNDYISLHRDKDAVVQTENFYKPSYMLNWFRHNTIFCTVLLSAMLLFSVQFITQISNIINAIYNVYIFSFLFTLYFALPFCWFSLLSMNHRYLESNWVGLKLVLIAGLKCLQLLLMVCIIFYFIKLKVPFSQIFLNDTCFYAETFLECIAHMQIAAVIILVMLQKLKRGRKEDDKQLDLTDCKKKQICFVQVEG